MKKRMWLAALAGFFVLGSASAGLADTVECTVESTEGAKVVLDCGDKAAKLEAGAVVKVKPAKKKAMEGC